MIAWFLVLMISFSSIQVVMADIPLQGHSSNCQMANMESQGMNDSNTGKPCSMNHDLYCQDNVSCTGHTSSFLQISTLSLLTVNKSASQKYQIDNDKITARYPELLKRPPKY